MRPSGAGWEHRTRAVRRRWGATWTTSTYKGAIKGTVSGNTFSYTYPGGGGEATVNASQMQGRTDGGKTLLMQRSQ